MKKDLPWHIAEKAIFKEKSWLKTALDWGPFEKSAPIDLSKDEMLRQISILIVSGKLKARELISPQANQLWVEEGWHNKPDCIKERHGGLWHRETMQLIRQHFEKDGFKIETEPSLNYGRADLGIYKKDYCDLYIEVGTTSLFKTWLNLYTMPGVVFLFVPSNYKAIEFKT